MPDMTPSSSKAGLTVRYGYRLMDGKAEIKDARHLWGQGIRRTTVEINQQMGPEASVAAIGQAGENLVPMSVVINSYSHSAGGIGGVMGSKNLKAIGVRGTGSVRIAGNKEEWEKVVKLHLSLLGANNQHVVPNSPQPWAEYYSAGSRWVASKGRKWGAADPNIDTGACDPHNLNRIAYRTNNAAFFLGEKAWQYTVRGNGCTSLPHPLPYHAQSPCGFRKIRHSGSGTEYLRRDCCLAELSSRHFPTVPRARQRSRRVWSGMHLADDLGIWENYGQLQRDFQELYYNGIIKSKVAEKEFKSYSWDKYEKGIPPSSSNFFQESRIKKVNWPPRWGWGPDTSWSGGVFRSRSGRKIKSSPTGRWGIPNIIPTKMPDNAE